MSLPLPARVSDSYGKVIDLRSRQSARLRDLVTEIGVIRERVCRTTERFTHSVLVLDDDPDVVQSLRNLLTTELPGIPVYGATSCEEGKALWDRHRCGVVIADFLLGGGYDGVEFLHSLGRSPEAILISGVSDAETLRRAAMVAGAEAMPKPCVGISDLVLSLMDRRFGTLSLTTDGRKWVKVSSGWATELGYPQGTLEEMSWDHLSPDGTPALGDTARTFTSRVRAVDGSIKNFQWMCSPRCEGGLYYCSAQVVS